MIFLSLFIENSRQDIKKYILTKYNLPENDTTKKRFRSAIYKGVDKGIFYFPNGKYIWYISLSVVFV